METSRPVRATRLLSEPVVGPHSLAGYGAIFNAGLVEFGGVLHLVARAVRDGYSPDPTGATRFRDYVSDVVVFVSRDGIHYHFDRVLLAAPPHGEWCYEDPRVQLVTGATGPRLVMTYTVLPLPPREQAPHYIGATPLVVRDGRLHLEPDADPTHRLGPLGLANKDGVLSDLAGGRVALVQRLGRDVQVADFDTFEDLWTADEHYWVPYLADLDEHVIIRPGPDVLGVGAGAPPLLTEHGLLLLYHERVAGGIYTMNAALLDARHANLLAVLDEPLLVPELDWECHGDVDMVVFVQGAVRRGEDELYLTYGAADRCVGVARIGLGDLLAALTAPSR